MRFSNTLKKLAWSTDSSVPFTAKEIRPVSSDTTTVTESEISLIPIAALCLEPYLPANAWVVGV